MKILLTLSLLSVLSIMSCKTKKDGVKKDNTTNKISYKSDQIIATLEKTACFGVCPVFNAVVYGDGKVVYKGAQNVTNIGLFEGKVSMDKLHELVSKAKEIDYATLENKYDGPVTDLPSTTSSVFIDGKTKSIMARYNAPQKLYDFHKYFDEWLKDIELKQTKAKE